MPASLAKICQYFNALEHIMHKSSLLRMHWFIESELDSNAELAILDVGSYGVNGTYRGLFKSPLHKYVGLDLVHGPNVDIVPNKVYSWEEIPDETFDVVVSGQAFEHIEFFWLTFLEMVRVLKKDGKICIIAPNGFGEHRYPVDCWRFFTDGMVALARYASLEILHAHTNAGPSVKDHKWFSKSFADSMLVATKPYSGKPVIVDLSSYKTVPSDHKRMRGSLVPYSEYRSTYGSFAYSLRRRAIMTMASVAVKIKSKMNTVLSFFGR